MPTRPRAFASVKSMLFSEKYSDLVFTFEDGSIINAHQFVVFERSEYFEWVKFYMNFCQFNVVNNNHSEHWARATRAARGNNVKDVTTWDPLEQSMWRNIHQKRSGMLHTVCTAGNWLVFLGRFDWFLYSLPAQFMSFRMVLTYLYTDKVQMECFENMEMTINLILMSKVFRIPGLQVV